MQLVTVRFTTKHIVSVFDDAGRKVREYEDAIPQCIAGIPRSTAEGYRKFDNWAVEPYFSEPDRKTARPKGRHIDPRAFVDKIIEEDAVIMDHLHKAELRRRGKSAAPAVAHAAATGDLSAAINMGLIND